MTDKITIWIERDILEHTVVALEYAYNKNDEMVMESIRFLRAALAQKAEPPSMQPLPNHDNHHNALKCPYCNPRGLVFAEPTAQPADIVNPISQQEPVAYRHSKTGQLSDLEEEVSLADGDEWAEPLYATPPAAPAPAVREPSTYRQIAEATGQWANVPSDKVIGIWRASERAHGIGGGGNG